MAKRDTEVPVPKLDDTVTTDLPPLDSTTPEQPDGSAPAAEPVKRRRRRRKATPEPEPQPADDIDPEERNFAQALAMGFDFGGKIAAGMRGNHWLFSDQETETLGAVWAKALHPYMGRLAPYTPFILATVVTAGVMMPKIQRDRMNRATDITPIRRVPVVPAIDGPQPVTAERVADALADAGMSAHVIEGSPELHADELPANSIGGAAARRNRKRQENPPGVI